MSWQWREHTIGTVGDLVSVLGTIVASGSEEDAADFTQTYREHSEHADSNIGYALGYLSQENMTAGLRLFKARHPIFGGVETAGSMTPEQSFELGQKVAAARAEKISREG